ncbi:VOC family protein [Cellulomonas sp. ICMP 17802]|uniref:VOC family protein n=1 Tax=Cellulomonas sp. ICMP 17802 TaxID=3239199 RepID=UPI00351BE0BF
MGNAVMWFEITSTNPDRARDFYTKLFDWSSEAPPELGGYNLIETGAPAETIGGGIGAADPDGLPPGILLYVRVDDLAATLTKAAELGGSTLLEPMKLPGENGSVAILADPDGHAVGLWA